MPLTYKPPVMQSTIGRQRAQQIEAEAPNPAMPALAALPQTNTATPMGQQVVNKATNAIMPSSQQEAMDVMKKAGFDPSQLSSLAQPAAATPAAGADPSMLSSLAGGLDKSMGGQAINGIFGTTGAGQGLASQGLGALMSLFA